jgi:hypothetical protein
MLDLFKKKSLPQKRRGLRNKIKHIERTTTWPNRRLAAKLSRYRQKYADLGIELWESIPSYGLDTTASVILNEDGKQLSIHQLGDYILGGPDSTEGLTAEEHGITYQYRDGTKVFIKTGTGELITNPGDYEEIEGYE